MKYVLTIGIGFVYALNGNLSTGIGYQHNGGNYMERSAPKVTKKEGEVLGWVQKALSNKEIAKELNLAESTVKMHVGNLIRKYGVRNRTQLSSFSLQGQSIDLNAYLPKGLEAKPLFWALREGEKIVAVSFQKSRPTLDWEGVYIKKIEQGGNGQKKPQE
jgi:DNA-binding CsgD family transcriptional regulator